MNTKIFTYLVTAFLQLSLLLGVTLSPVLAQHGSQCTPKVHNTTILPTDLRQPHGPTDCSNSFCLSHIFRPGHAAILHMTYMESQSPDLNNTLHEVLNELTLPNGDKMATKVKLDIRKVSKPPKKMPTLPALFMTGADHALIGKFTREDLKFYLSTSFSGDVTLGEFNKSDLLKKLCEMNVSVDDKFLSGLDSQFTSLAANNSSSMRLLLRKPACNGDSCPNPKTMGCRPVIVCCDGEGNPYVVIICGVKEQTVETQTHRPCKKGSSP